MRTKYLAAFILLRELLVGIMLLEIAGKRILILRNTVIILDDIGADAGKLCKKEGGGRTGHKWPEK